MARTLLTLIFLPAFVLTLSSCASDECDDNKNSLPLAEFYSSLPEPQPVSLDSISIYGIGAQGDSILVDSAASVGQCHLPFRIDTGETTYVIQYLQQAISEIGIRDTVTFRYTIDPQFVSSACGAVYYYDDIRIEHTNHFLDSVSCPGRKITNENKVNILMYFRIDESSNALIH